MGRLQNGEKFDAVARDLSEDKAKTGKSFYGRIPFPSLTSQRMAMGTLTRYCHTQEARSAGRPRGIWIPSSKKWLFSCLPAPLTVPRLRESRRALAITSSWWRGASSRDSVVGRQPDASCEGLILFLPCRVSHAIRKEQPREGIPTFPAILLPSR